MGAGLVFLWGVGQPSAPAWVRSPSGTSVTGYPESGQASDQANWCARPVPATTTDRSDEGHAETAEATWSRPARLRRVDNMSITPASQRYARDKIITASGQPVFDPHTLTARSAGIALHRSAGLSPLAHSVRVQGNLEDQRCHGDC